jgi:hypothetical protein
VKQPFAWDSSAETTNPLASAQHPVVIYKAQLANSSYEFRTAFTSQRTLTYGALSLGRGRFVDSSCPTHTDAIDVTELHALFLTLAASLKAM